MIDWGPLRANRDKLVAYQRADAARPSRPGEIRLDVGCGDTARTGYVGVDLYNDNAQIKADIRRLEGAIAENSVSQIVCQHVLEHVVFSDIEVALRSMYRVLKPGGVLEIGMPDMTIMCQDFLESSVADKWTRCLWPFYPVVPVVGQTHVSGLDLAKAVELCKTVGFNILEAYNYDGNGVAPCLLVMAEKPNLTPHPLEHDLIAGTFTHRTTQLGDLAASFGKYHPGIPFIVHIKDVGVPANMESLRLKMAATGKRFWLLMDDDTRLLDSKAVAAALELVNRPEIAVASVWEDDSPNRHGVAIYSNIVFGYFMMIDSHKVGAVPFDTEIPGRLDFCDVEYCLHVGSLGFELAIAPATVQHLRVTGTRTTEKAAEEYVYKKWNYTPTLTWRPVV